MRRELDQAKKSASRVAELQTQNKELTSKLATANKQAADLAKQNADLDKQLASEKKRAGKQEHEETEPSDWSKW